MAFDAATDCCVGIVDDVAEGVGVDFVEDCAGEGDDGTGASKAVGEVPGRYSGAVFAGEVFVGVVSKDIPGLQGFEPFRLAQIWLPLNANRNVVMVLVVLAKTDFEIRFPTV